MALGDDVLKEYRSTFAEASQRGRWILLAIVTASVIAFSAAWNSLPFNWTDQRYATFDYALTQRAWDDRTTVPSNDGDAARFLRVRKYLEAVHLMNEDALRKELEGLQQSQRELRYVRIPFFGVTFDVNDLGLISGLAFFVLLVMFHYSLANEQRCLTAVLRVDPASYELLAIGQVLTVPDVSAATGMRRSTLVFWRSIPKMLFALPLMVQLLVFVGDLMTWGIGEGVSPGHAAATILIDAVLLVTNAFLTLSCIKYSVDMDREWDRAREARQ